MQIERHFDDSFVGRLPGGVDLRLPRVFRAVQPD